MNNKILLFILFNSILFINIIPKNYDDKIQINKEKYSIIFIHGTYGINFYTLLKITLYKIFHSTKKLKNLFTKITELRFKEELSNHKAICGNNYGLEEILSSNSNHLAYEYVLQNIHKLYENFLNTKDIKYYSFNWNGCLSDQLRKEESKILYNELKKIKDIDPDRKVIIIGFSHGGNIALSLQEESEKNNYPFKVDLLILLATPIGKSSEYNAKVNFFTKIINFYSSKDFYQISDIFFNFPTTKRIFKNAPHIINIEIKYIKKHHLSNKKIIIFPNHKYFGSIYTNNELPVFLTILPNILKHIYIKNNIEHINNYIAIINIENNFKVIIKKR